MHIQFDKIDRLIKIHNRIRCLVLFDYRWFDEICNRVKYLISKKSGITDSINHNFGKIKIDSNDSLPIEKIFTFHSVIIFIKSVANKNENEYYYYTLYKVKSNTNYF